MAPGSPLFARSHLDEAVAWLAKAGGWDRAHLNARPWSQTL